jgi:hypothetical protein
MHLNRDCRYPDLDNLFIKADVTAEMREHYPSVSTEVKSILDAICKASVPEVDIGPHCLEPTECQFVSHCWKHIPEVSVFNLPGIKQRKWELYHAGIVKLDDPNLNELTELQQRVVQAFKTGERFVDSRLMKKMMETWQYPFVYLDFETINPAIPRYFGTRPYQQVPFQFSVHIQTDADAEVEHIEYLHLDASDPRPALIEALLDACGTTGSIIAYFGKFETDRIKELAEFSPAHHDALLALTERIVDPLPIFREAVYDNAFAGSFSLKKVAPALLGDEESYEGMEVANGGDAQRAFEEIISPAADPERVKMLETALREYCKKDTKVMVDLVKWMFAN